MILKQIQNREKNRIRRSRRLLLRKFLRGFRRSNKGHLKTLSSLRFKEFVICYLLFVICLSTEYFHANFPDIPGSQAQQNIARLQNLLQVGNGSFKILGAIHLFMAVGSDALT